MAPFLDFQGPINNSGLPFKPLIQHGECSKSVVWVSIERERYSGLSDGLACVCSHYSRD